MTFSDLQGPPRTHYIVYGAERHIRGLICPQIESSISKLAMHKEEISTYEHQNFFLGVSHDDKSIYVKYDVIAFTVFEIRPTLNAQKC